MFIYAVFDRAGAAERAARQVEQAVPGARAERISPITRGAPANGPVPGGQESPSPVMFYGGVAPGGEWNPMAFAPVQPQTGGQAVLRVRVPDKAAAGRAMYCLRRAGGEGVRTDAD